MSESRSSNRPRRTVALTDLRRFSVARSLFASTTLPRVLDRMGFVQADPIRAPARAQDLMLRHRVAGYRAGDLERRYASLGIEEDYFVVYGFVTKALEALMHPRSGPRFRWSAARARRAQLLLDFVRERGAVHPREVDEHFAHGRVRNYWGGSSNATTQLLGLMHYRGMLRIARREGGVRIYAEHEHGAPPADATERNRRIDALVDAAVHLYAPLSAASLSTLVITRLPAAAPQWMPEMRKAVNRAKERLPHATVEGVEWYWPAGEDPLRAAEPTAVRLLAPFDPVVWDRARFEAFWGWAYRFEAYVPQAKRKLGYYALPLLWRDRVIGWGNVTVAGRQVACDLGYVESAPRDRAFRMELEAELGRLRGFLLTDSAAGRGWRSRRADPSPDGSSPDRETP